MDPNKIISLFLLIMIGYMAKKARFVSSDIKGHISNLVLNITLPLYIFTAMQFEFSTDVLKETGTLVLVSFLFYAGVTLLSYLYAKVFKLKDTKKDVFQYVIIFSNVGYMGYPIMFELAGEKGMFYAAIYNLSFNVLTWTLGVYIMSRHKNSLEKQTLGEKLVHVLNPSLFAVILGFTCFVLSIRIPELFMGTFKSIGQTTTPLSMMFIGIILAEIKAKDMVSDISIFIVAGIRLLAIPMLVFLILKGIGLEGLLLTIPVVLSAMPAAANTAVVASRYENDYQLASKLIFVTTLLSIGTIPIILKIIG
ncbi:MAG: AEC family transporter [Clostridiales bacterium]|nr:AEC family transporter [Clostridiales bacterium]